MDIEPQTEPVDGPVVREYPEGDYAIVELMGHTTLVGRIAEVERYGTKMLAIETLFNGAFLGPIYQGGPSIYRLTPCSAEVAFKKQPTRNYQLPAALLAIVPQALLEAPIPVRVVIDEDQPDEDAAGSDEPDPDDAMNDDPGM